MIYRTVEMIVSIFYCDNSIRGDRMSLYLNLIPRLPEFNIEVVTLDNLYHYENIFYSNREYYLLTEGHPAAKQDCIETIQYGNDFPEDMCHCIGFSLKGEAVAWLSVFEDYPEINTVYIGLFLMNEKFKRKSIGTKIISALIEEAFNTKYNTVKLSVQDNNISGCSFWRKLGFQITEKRDCGHFFNLSMKLRKGI